MTDDTMSDAVRDAIQRYGAEMAKTVFLDDKGLTDEQIGRAFDVTLAVGADIRLLTAEGVALSSAAHLDHRDKIKAAAWEHLRRLRGQASLTRVKH